MGKKFFLSIAFLILFILLSYTVAKEWWQRVDFDATVKLQDRLPRRFDGIFSYFSLLGSAEVTVGFSLVLAFWAFLKRHLRAAAGWLMIAPASAVEVFGKLVLFHPGPPVLFHRSILPTTLPSFYVETDFSYPSGHMTRTVFLVAIFLSLVIFSSRRALFKTVIIAFLVALALLMALTRVYLGEHWLSDVLGGTLLGLSAGILASALIIRKPAEFVLRD